jgi:hypothetical protein
MKVARLTLHTCPRKLRTVAAIVVQGSRRGIWLVSFMHDDLGYIDLEQKSLQLLDGPRLSPMS